jgi:hypothetical protein
MLTYTQWYTKLISLTVHYYTQSYTQGEKRMWKQSTIFGEKLDLPSKEELEELCCESCYTAKEKTCVCKCHGAYHGLGRLNERSQQGKEETEKASC